MRATQGKPLKHLIHRRQVLLTGSLLGCAPTLMAQSDAPLRLLVGFAPGGGTDSVARLMAPRLSTFLKQNIIVDNRSGAGGNIATEALFKAAGDDNTFMLGTIGSLAVNQHLINMAFNPVTDLEMVGMAVTFSNILVVPMGSPITNFAQYLRVAKEPSTQLAFGTSGIGSAGHLAGELLKHVAKLNYQHVPYRGGAPAMADLLAGVLPSIFSTPSDALTYVQAKKLRALATTGSVRMEALPDVPTVAESGFADFEALNWYAYAAPPKTRSEQVRRLNAAIHEVLKDPAVIAQLAKWGMKAAPGTPEQLAQYARRESDKWAQVIKQANIKMSLK
jgi:tripartite-type tricarboxylate transporter receptor subunit TctC